MSGEIIESKEGRLAIRARVTVDCTGDGDVFGRAGAGARAPTSRSAIFVASMRPPGSGAAAT